ncbi:MAG: S1 RNA-binding domain-containing protein [Bacteroidetes bacterium]|nr:S1 RNA-binding domain-containing protein [Bacteroidota bacterium]
MGDSIHGIVVASYDFGVFVDIGHSCVGFVDVLGLNRNRSLSIPSQFAVGSSLKLVVVGHRDEEKRIWLSMQDAAFSINEDWAIMRSLTRDGDDVVVRNPVWHGGALYVAIDKIRFLGKIVNAGRDVHDFLQEGNTMHCEIVGFDEHEKCLLLRTYPE